MEEEWDQTGPALLAGLVILLAFFLFSVLVLNAPLPWGLGVAGVPLLLAILAYILLWNMQTEIEHQVTNLLLYGALISAPLFMIILLFIGLARGHYLQGLKLDLFSSFLIVGGGTAFMLIPALTLLNQHRVHQQALTSDQERQGLTSFREALRRQRTDGWGMTPQEIKKLAWNQIGLGIFIMAFGGFGLFQAIHRLTSLTNPERTIYLVGCLILLIGGLSNLHIVNSGLRLIRSANAYSEQGEQIVTLTGIIAGFWLDNSLFSQYRNRGELIKVQLPDGNDKILLVSPMLADLLPERAGEAVEIDYLFGCEAVIGVRAPIAGAS